MKFLATEIAFIILILVGGAQSLECKVCQQGMQGEWPITNTASVIDEGDFCQEDESLNMAPCDDSENACVKYNTQFDSGSSTVWTWTVTSFRCAVADQLAGPDSPFCKDFEPDVTKRFSDAFGATTTNFQCDVAESKVHEPEEQGGDGKDCEQEFCSGGEATQLNLALLAAILTLYRMI